MARPEPGTPGHHGAGGAPVAGPGGPGAAAAPPEAAKVEVDVEGIGCARGRGAGPRGPLRGHIRPEGQAAAAVQARRGRGWATTGPRRRRLPMPRSSAYDLVTDRRETFATGVSEAVVSGDGEALAYTVGSPGEARRLRVTSSSAKPDEEHDKEPPGRSNGFVDLGRPRVVVDPGPSWAEWSGRPGGYRLSNSGRPTFPGWTGSGYWTVTCRWWTGWPPGLSFPTPSGSYKANWGRRTATRWAASTGARPRGARPTSGPTSTGMSRVAGS